MIVAVDFDGVVGNLVKEWLRRYNQDYDDCIDWVTHDDWNIQNKVKEECGAKIWDYLHVPDLYEYVDPIDNAIEGITAIKARGHRVIYVTATNKYQQGSKFNWLVRNGLLETKYGTYSHDYVEVSDKSLIRADMLIDDHEGNLRNFKGLGVLFTQPYNSHVVQYFRGNWQDILTHFDELETKVEEGYK